MQTRLAMISFKDLESIDIETEAENDNDSDEGEVSTKRTPIKAKHENKGGKILDPKSENPDKPTCKILNAYLSKDCFEPLTNVQLLYPKCMCYFLCSNLSQCEVTINFIF